MLELFESEDDLIFATPTPNPVNEESDSDTSSDSPTNDSSDNFEDANENSNSNTSTLSPDEAEQPPPLPARLPMNLSNAQNLAEQFEIPEVHAAAIQGIIDNARQFNSQHPRPPPRHMHGHNVPATRKSTRNVTKPTNYAVFNKTGKK